MGQVDEDSPTGSKMLRDIMRYGPVSSDDPDKGSGCYCWVDHEDSGEFLSSM